MEITPRKMQSRANRHIFSASDDTVMTKQIRATHAPVGGHINVRPLLNVVQDIFHRASFIPHIVQVCVVQCVCIRFSIILHLVHN